MTQMTNSATTADAEVARLTEELADARPELDRLRHLCAELYHVAGTLGADARVLDTLYAAAGGQPIPEGLLLPNGR